MPKTTKEQAARQRRERRNALDALKLARGGCEALLEDGARCGYNRHPAALHWDHVGEKTYPGPAFRAAWAWERILAEVAKCELVCACCHAIRTAERGYGGGQPTHGRQRPPVVFGEFGRRPRVRRSHCRSGHPFDEENTYVSPQGQRQCKACRRQRREQLQRVGV